MFDAPVDAWYVWIGLGITSVVLFGLVLGLPTASPPEANAVADVVDTVAASAHTQTADRPLSVEEVKLGPDRVSLRGPGGTSHATFVYGPVTPVRDGTLLWEVVQGAAPEHVFDSPAAFRRAIRAARERVPAWRAADDRLVVRTVTWEGTDVTLVDA